MIDWTDEAIEAAFKRLQVDERKDEWGSYIRAALDAAVKAQPGIITADEFSNSQRRAYRLGRAEALEEAAKVAEELPPVTIIGYHDTHANSIAAAIRSLKEAKR